MHRYGTLPAAADALVMPSWCRPALAADGIPMAARMQQPLGKLPDG